MDSVGIAKAKREKLLAQLRRIDQFLELAEEFQNEADDSGKKPEPVPAPVQPQLTPGRAAIAAAAEHLKNHGPTSTAELLGVLEGKGIDPSPNSALDKRTTLSTLLSKEKDVFQNDKTARVWKLAKAEANNPPRSNEGG